MVESQLVKEYLHHLRTFYFIIDEYEFYNLLSPIVGNSTFLTLQQRLFLNANEIYPDFVIIIPFSS